MELACFHYSAISAPLSALPTSFSASVWRHLTYFQAAEPSALAGPGWAPPSVPLSVSLLDTAPSVLRGGRTPCHALSISLYFEAFAPSQCWIGGCPLVAPYQFRDLPLCGLDPEGCRDWRRWALTTGHQEGPASKPGSRPARRVMGWLGALPEFAIRTPQEKGGKISCLLRKLKCPSQSRREISCPQDTSRRHG